MNARDEINRLKDLWGLERDSDFANFIKTSKMNVDSWIKRNKIPEKWQLKIRQMHDNTQTQPATADAYYIKKITAYKASAGGGNEIDDLGEITAYETGEIMPIAKAFFKTPPGQNLSGIEIVGESMMPVLKPGDWVMFVDDGEFKGDGLYVLNFSGQLMVKILQLTPKGMMKIVSVNKDYQSYEIDLKESQERFRIICKVIKSIF
ncbi:MAG: transcriptional regulator [Campylobacter sp.]|nr:transcriptional regulator [Campylobacter sp.]